MGKEGDICDGTVAVMDWIDPNTSYAIRVAEEVLPEVIKCKNSGGVCDPGNCPAAEFLKTEGIIFQA